MPYIILKPAAKVLDIGLTHVYSLGCLLFVLLDLLQSFGCFGSACQGGCKIMVPEP